MSQTLTFKSAFCWIDDSVYPYAVFDCAYGSWNIGIKRWIESEAERLGVSIEEIMNPTPDDSDIDVPVPTCFTCKHLHTGDHPSTWMEPADSGEECNHPDQEMINENFVEPPDDMPDNFEVLAEFYAKQCPGYEYFDREAHNKAQDDALASEIKTIEKYAQTYKDFGIDF